MIKFEMVESTPLSIKLDSEQLRQLRSLSRKLASDSIWWGHTDDLDVPERQVIDVQLLAGDQYIVQVRDAVGSIQLSGLQIIISPKIPLSHFTYIAKNSFGLAGRSADTHTTLNEGDSFFDLVYRWFLSSSSQIASEGLARDYQDFSEHSSWVRGKLDPISTATNIAAGKPLAHCQFQEYTVNTPLNQILATALRVGRLRGVSGTANMDALTVSRHFQAVSSFGDNRFLPTRAVVPSRYREAVDLATSIIQGTGRSLEFGGKAARSFLIRTPPIIEKGIRNILSTRLPVRIRAGGRVLKPTQLRANPDLEVGPPPFTADVKYKINRGTWNRADLAQAVFFAAAYNSPLAAVLSFADADYRLPEVPVGRIKVTSLNWSIGENSTPESSANSLVQALEAWSNTGSEGLLVIGRSSDQDAQIPAL